MNEREVCINELSSYWRTIFSSYIIYAMFNICIFRDKTVLASGDVYIYVIYLIYSRSYLVTQRVYGKLLFVFSYTESV